MVRFTSFLSIIFLLSIGCGDDDVPQPTPDASVADAALADAMFVDAALDSTSMSGPDTMAPTLDVSLRKNMMSPSRLIHARGVTKDEREFASLTWSLGESEAPASVSEDGHFDVAITLEPGENNLRLIAKDATGNERVFESKIYFGHRVSVGNSQAAFIRNGQLYTWGRNELGQLGNGTTNGSRWGDDPAQASLPVRYEVALENPISVVTRQTYAIALMHDGQIATWGSNRSGQLGYSTPKQCGRDSERKCEKAPRVVEGVENVVAVQAGFEHTLVLLSDGRVMSWGSNDFGELGRLPEEDWETTPGLIEGLANIVQLAAGSTTSYALDADGTLWAWGRNDSGQLGLGSKDDQKHPMPIKVDGIPKIDQIASANSTVFARTHEGDVLAWGKNHAGQCGVGDGASGEILNPKTLLTEDENTPLRNVSVLSGDGFIAGAVLEDGRVFTWGFGRLGQLGRGSRDDGERKLDNEAFAGSVAVSEADRSVFDIVELEAGAGGPMLALSRDGHLFGWGWSFRGSLGLEGAIDAWAYSTPVLVFANE